ncbi:MAG: hypothetical protein HW416_799 [Chloroflexi bacterium]|nr:hypothetical protein [Chloroflexota bacterium]
MVLKRRKATPWNGSSACARFKNAASLVYPQSTTTASGGGSDGCETPQGSADSGRPTGNDRVAGLARPYRSEFQGRQQRAVGHRDSESECEYDVEDETGGQGENQRYAPSLARRDLEIEECHQQNRKRKADERHRDRKANDCRHDPQRAPANRLGRIVGLGRPSFRRSAATS